VSLQLQSVVVLLGLYLAEFNKFRWGDRKCTTWKWRTGKWRTVL